jgi:hypothetical protein
MNELSSKGYIFKKMISFFREANQESLAIELQNKLKKYY